MTNCKTPEVGRHSPDGGWGWMVAIGCFIILLLLPTLTIGFSILFSGFLLEREASSTTVAWIFNIHTLLWNLMGPFAGPLTKEFGFRKVCFGSSVLAACCVFACAFSTSTTHLMVFFSLAGLFGGLTCKPCYLIIPIYFDKRRGLANAIIMAGLCTSQFSGPPIIRYLQRQFGFTGATLIISGLLLNSCVGCSFFHPVDWHMKKSPAISSGEIDKQTAETESLVGDKEEKNVLKTPNKDLLLIPKDVLRNRTRPHQISESSRRSSLALSTTDLSGISPTSEDHQRASSPPGPEESPDGALRRSSLPVRVIKSLISDLGILKSHRAKIICFGGLFVINGFLNFIMTVPFAMQAAGYTPEDAAWCLSITGVCNFVARLSASTLSDYSWFNMRIMYMIGAVIIATTTAVFSFLTNLMWMQVTLACWALGIGINISLYVLVMARIMGLEKMPAIFGTQSFVVGVGYVVLGPLIGFVRDVTGSYAVSMWLMSAEVWLTVILWCFMPAAIARDQKMQEKEEEAKKHNKV